MLTLLAPLALAVGLPSAELSWKGEEGRLLVRGPAGEHVAEGAVARIEVVWGEREASFVVDGADLARGLPIPAVRGAPLSGNLRVSLCEDDGTACRLVEAVVAGAAGPARKGRVALSVSAPEPAAVDQRGAPSPFRRDATADVEAALADAARSGRTVLLDFSAVWCPPCNLLAAEVLAAPDVEEVLSDVLVVVVDVDAPSSWALKDRYAVGGYPTVVAVDGQGREVDRLLGYDGREATLAWIADVADGAVARPIPDVAPEAADPAEAAVAALYLVERELEGWEPWLARAEAAPELVETRIARLAARPAAADLEWLVANAPDRAREWVMHAAALSDAAPAAVRAAVALALRGADPVAAADLLWVAAQATPEADRPLIYGAAAATLEGAFVGDEARDRAHVTFLAGLKAEAGDLDGGLALLARFEARYPDEPTWALSASGLLREAGRVEEALERADAAVALAWGDNALRAAKARADALIALGRADEARAWAAEVLAAAPAPEAGLDVRTHRYRDALRAIADGG